jgi:hypothetical protein
MNICHIFDSLFCSQGQAVLHSLSTAAETCSMRRIVPVFIEAMVYLVSHTVIVLVQVACFAVCFTTKKKKKKKKERKLNWSFAPLSSSWL